MTLQVVNSTFYENNLAKRVKMGLPVSFLTMLTRKI